MKDDVIEQEIQAKGLTAPRVTPADIEANIASEYFFTAADGVRGAAEVDALHCRHAEVDTDAGESACASPENFDAEVGRKIARANAVNKIWPLMGYALKQQLHEQA